VVNVPSYEVRPGEIIGVRERSKSLEVISAAVASRGNAYPWLEWDSSMMSGKFMNYPQRSEIPENIREQLIVELYSK
jgi:small subunit ribosomal protein S4